MGLLADGESFLCDIFAATEDVQIDYAIPPYGGGTTYLITATPTAPVSELEPGAYTVNQSNNRDFIIRYDDLAGVNVIPDVGHRITEYRDTETFVYEVMDQPGDGAWRWHGADYKAYRVHATLISRT